jgi:hypothetical protein
MEATKYLHVGIFADEKVLQFLELLQALSDQCLQELHQVAVEKAYGGASRPHHPLIPSESNPASPYGIAFLAGLHTIRNWSSAVLQEEADRLRKHCPYIEDLYRYTVGRYLQELYKHEKPQTIDINVPLLRTFLYAYYVEIGANTITRTLRYFNTFGVEKKSLVMDCIRGALHKVLESQIDYQTTLQFHNTRVGGNTQDAQFAGPDQYKPSAVKSKPLRPWSSTPIPSASADVDGEFASIPVPTIKPKPRSQTLPPPFQLVSRNGATPKKPETTIPSSTASMNEMIREISEARSRSASAPRITAPVNVTPKINPATTKTPSAVKTNLQSSHQPPQSISSGTKKNTTTKKPEEEKVKTINLNEVPSASPKRVNPPEHAPTPTRSKFVPPLQVCVPSSSSKPVVTSELPAKNVEEDSPYFKSSSSSKPDVASELPAKDVDADSSPKFFDEVDESDVAREGAVEDLS